MPTRRKTLAELEKSGTLSRHRGRYEGRLQAHINAVAPVGPPPKHLPAEERRIWTEVAKTAPENTLTVSDRIALEVVVKLTAKLRSNVAKPAEISQLMGALGRLSLTPVDRNKTGAGPVPEKEAQSQQDRVMQELADAFD